MVLLLFTLANFIPTTPPATLSFPLIFDRVPSPFVTHVPLLPLLLFHMFPFKLNIQLFLLNLKLLLFIALYLLLLLLPLLYPSSSFKCPSSTFLLSPFLTSS